jgi:AraC family transcriptional regulator, glycine betaine-responsive activator
VRARCGRRVSAPARRKASNGIAIVPHAAPSRPAACSVVVVCAGIGAHTFDNRRTLTWLRNLGRRNVMVGAVSTGTWLLAKAGLLQGQRCTIHWEDLQSFAETYPRLNLTANLYEIDGKRFTCSGGTATLDVMLRLPCATVIDWRLQ